MYKFVYSMEFFSTIETILSKLFNYTGICYLTPYDVCIYQFTQNTSVTYDSVSRDSRSVHVAHEIGW